MQVWLMGMFFLFTNTIYASQPPSPHWHYVETKLKKSGFEKPFIKELKKNYDPKNFETVVRLNLLLFLKKADYHGIQVSDKAAEDVRDFVAKHKLVLKEAEKKYGVSSRVVASLLWMETRHGETYGNFHVASGFLDLIQSERKDVITYLQNEAHEFTDNVTSKQRREIIKRTKIKTDWAISELRALQSMYKKNHKIVQELKGSFSGAFGMPQFLPSSYIKWSKSYNGKKIANLFTANDAIYSVSNYLKGHGWKKNKPKTFVKALMKYNNSRDYANAILKLEEMSGPSKRVPGSH